MADEDWDDDVGECPECGGDGWVSRYEEDPLWYGEDDLYMCETCMVTGVVGRER